MKQATVRWQGRNRLAAQGGDLGSGTSPITHAPITRMQDLIDAGPDGLVSASEALERAVA